MASLPAEYLDPNTPPDVLVTDRSRPRITDPTLGEPLGGPPQAPGPTNPTHPLVTIGDSLTHGMSSGAVFNTDLSWPALVAVQLGATGFTHPRYGGPMDGLPVNIETLFRQLEAKFGTDINLFEKFALPVALQRCLDHNEDYWEGRAADKPPRPTGRYDNLGIYGWDLRDALSFTAERAATNAGAPSKDNLLAALPEHDNDIAADSVLAPFGPAATQLTAAAAHGTDGGIGTLVVALGANNALDSVVSKKVAWSGDGFDQVAAKGAYNVWRPTHFATEYAALVALVKTIRTGRVVLATVPHVTIAPIAKGVNPDQPGEKWRPGSRFFPYYTDPWIAEENFRPNRHRHITHQQARAIDSAIDQYNDTIVDAVKRARREGREWSLLDLCGILDGLAERRYKQDKDAADANDWKPYPLPAAIADLTTRFFLSNATGRLQGGLFGLDAVHPTTSGYGIIAQALLDVLTTSGLPSTPIDFATLRTRDTLNSHPPALVKQLLDLASPFMAMFISRA